jgi:transcriptional antiterminator NusG
MNEEINILNEEKYTVRDEENPNLRWYIVQTQSNCENKVKENLKEAIIRNNVEDKIREIFNPIIESTTLRAGKKKIIKTKPFPGYVFVFAEMDDVIFNIIKHTGRVLGFAGTKATNRLLPMPMPDREVKNILNIIDAQKEKEQGKYTFAEGVYVTINNESSPFNGFNGKIVRCNNEKGSAKISIEIFNKLTDVEVPLSDLIVTEIE